MALEFSLLNSRNISAFVFEDLNPQKLWFSCWFPFETTQHGGGVKQFEGLPQNPLRGLVQQFDSQTFTFEGWETSLNHHSNGNV